MINSRRVMRFPSAGIAASVFTGSGMTCAIIVNGTLQCWGSNLHGAVSSPPASCTSCSLPVATLPWLSLEDVADVSVQSTVLVALRNGSILCWGYNNFGNCGVGHTTLSIPSSAAVQVSGITSAVTVAASNIHSCAVLSTQTVTCWGRGASGQLGYGNTANRLTPNGVVAVNGPVQQVSVAKSGGAFTCALLVRGTVQCWGDNSYGQLGLGDTLQRSSPGPELSFDINVTSVSLGGTHACVLLLNGSVSCWGSGSEGQLG